MKDISRKTMVSFALILLYKLMLDFVYVNFVYKNFAYTGFVYDLNPTKYFIGILYLLLIFIFLPKDKAKASSIFLQIHFFIMVIPMLSLYGLTNESDVFMFSITVLIIMQCVILNIFPNIKFVRLHKSNKLLYLLITVITVVVYASMIRANGLPDISALNLLKVYEVRSSTVTSFLMSYLVNWQAKIINPFLITIGYLKNKRGILISGIVLQLLIFMMTGHRSFLFIPVGIIIVIIALNKRLEILNALGIVANLGVLSSYLMYVVLGDILISSVFIRRFLFVPAKIKFNYFDFFSQNQFIYFSQGLIGKLFGIDFPYNIPRNNFMSFFYGGTLTSSANTGYLGDAYSHMGFPGMFVISLVFVLIMILINSLGSRTDNTLVVGLSLFSIVALNDVALLTTLLTGGLLLLLLILYLYKDLE